MPNKKRGVLFVTSILLWGCANSESARTEPAPNTSSQATADVKAPPHKDAQNLTTMGYVTEPANTARESVKTAWQHPEYVGISKSRVKGMNMGTFQVATTDINQIVMPGVRAKDYHLGQMVALTQYWCVGKADSFQMQWNYWAASRHTFEGQYVMSCGQARQVVQSMGEGSAVPMPIHVRKGGVKEADIQLLLLDSQQKIATLKSLEKRFASPCVEHFCKGQSYLEK